MRRQQKTAREQFKDLFYLHRGERRGSLFLIGILIVLLAWVVYVQWIRSPDVPDLAAVRSEMEAWSAHRMALSEQAARDSEPFPFDPNTIERDEWLALGLSERQVDGIERYMSKGGRFRTKSDVSKLYALTPADYERLHPFILLPDSLPKKRYQQREPKKWPEQAAFASTGERPAWKNERQPLRKVEVNSADSLALVALPGIGPSFAKGILSYRDRLGGFISLDQLAEVYVLKDKPDALARMTELLDLDTLAVQRIPINTCTVEELAEHPYARWKLAKPLIAYRAQHGPFRTVADIRGCILIDDEAFRKLAPYLSVE
jgi:competence protein ComEA